MEIQNKNTFFILKNANKYEEEKNFQSKWDFKMEKKLALAID